MRAVSRKNKYRDKQTDGRAAAAHKHETVEKFFRKHFGRNDSRLIFRKIRREMRLHDRFQSIAAVDAEKPKERRQQYENKALEKPVGKVREKSVKGFHKQRTERVYAENRNNKIIEHRKRQRHDCDREKRGQHSVEFPVSACGKDIAFTFTEKFIEI